MIPLYEDFGSTSINESRVRIVHASPDAPAVDIDVGDDASFELAGLERFTDTGPDGLLFPSETVLQIAIGINGSRVTAFTAPALPSDDDVFVIATGRVADLPRDATGFSLLVVGPDGVIELTRQNPTVYALHASPDALAVDIRVGVDGPTLYPELMFGELGLAQVSPGDYSLGFFSAGDPGTTPLAAAEVNDLVAGERYLAIATGMLTPAADEARFQLFTYQELFTVDGTPRVRAIHASPDAPVVDISAATGTTLETPPAFPELEFGEASDGAGLALPVAPMLRIGVAPTRTTAAVATFNLDTSIDLRGFVIAAGALSPAPDEQGFQLLMVNTATSPWSVAAVLPNAN